MPNQTKQINKNQLLLAKGRGEDISLPAWNVTMKIFSDGCWTMSSRIGLAILKLNYYLPNFQVVGNLICNEMNSLIVL